MTSEQTVLADQYDGLRTAAGEAIKARLAASQPARPTRPAKTTSDTEEPR
jgi:hypothetical protein